METLILKVDENIYKDVLKALESFKNGLVIEKESQAQKIKRLFKSRKVKIFEDVENPIKWQQKVRSEWE